MESKENYEKYKKTIEECVKAINVRKEKEENKLYWEWIIMNLVADLDDYLSNGANRWRLEPMDNAWSKYGRLPDNDPTLVHLRKMWKMFTGEDLPF